MHIDFDVKNGQNVELMNLVLRNADEPKETILRKIFSTGLRSVVLGMRKEARSAVGPYGKNLILIKEIDEALEKRPEPCMGGIRVTRVSYSERNE